jgi:hypothetical protein
MKEIWTTVKDPAGLEVLSPLIYSLLNDEGVTRAILGAVMVSLLALVLHRARTTEAAIAGSLGILILCSPTIHPWYWLPIVPFALASGSRLWTALAAASPLSYLLYEGWSEAAVLGLCYGLPVLVVARGLFGGLGGGPRAQSGRSGQRAGA